MEVGSNYYISEYNTMHVYSTISKQLHFTYTNPGYTLPTYRLVSKHNQPLCTEGAVVIIKITFSYESVNQWKSTMAS